jgi:hypothetical protein
MQTSYRAGNGSARPGTRSCRPTPASRTRHRQTHLGPVSSTLPAAHTRPQNATNARTRRPRGTTMPSREERTAGPYLRSRVVPSTCTPLPHARAQDEEHPCHQVRSSPGALHKHRVGALTSRAAFRVRPPLSQSLRGDIETHAGRRCCFPWRLLRKWSASPRSSGAPVERWRFRGSPLAGQAAGAVVARQSLSTDESQVPAVALGDPAAFQSATSRR